MLKGVLQFGLTRRPIILLALLVFVGAGVIAFTKLNIEAYPNPAPVILEITAQASGLSAEEMERYYTIPMEVGLASTPGVDIIRSTSFYGLSFVRVTFNYGVDYYFALTQAAISLQQNVNLPGNAVPSIQGSSLVGEIYRYQVTGPEHFGLTNLRTIEDWIVQRRLLTVPGVVQVNTWGGTTKEFEVEVGLHKLDAYGVTLPQVIAAIGNANVNVGGRTINFGQQSVNIRGIGLLNSGGNEDLTQGYHVEDIENIVLSQTNGVPVKVRDVANVRVGYMPRLGKAGRDKEDDVVAAIVVMNRTLHTNDVAPRIKAAIDKLNIDGTLPPGVKLVPFYDRTVLVSVTTKTVLHNLIFGCILVFLIQWIFLGNLRSAIIVGVNIPFALFFSIIILVVRGEDANLLSVGAVDFGIIVDSAVILVENIFRNFQGSAEHRQQIVRDLAEGRYGEDPTRGGADSHAWTDRLRIIFASTLQVDKAVFFSTAVTVAAFVPLFTMQGVEGQIFNPMARTYGYALFGALLATFTVTPVLASILLPEHIEETETIVVRALRWVYSPLLRWSMAHRAVMVMIAVALLAVFGLLLTRLGTEFLPALEEGNLWIRASHAADHIAGSRHAAGQQDARHSAAPSGSDHRGVAARAAGQWQRRFRLQQRRVLRAAQAVRRMGARDDQGKAGQRPAERICRRVRRHRLQFLAIYSGQRRGGLVRASKAPIRSKSSAAIWRNWSRFADQVMKEMAKVEGVTDLGVFPVLGQPNLNVKVNRERAARYGLNSGDVNNVVQAALGGTPATTLLEADRQFNVTVRLSPEYRDVIDTVRHVKVGYQTPSGVNAYVPLSELADISLDTGASYIYHERNERFIPIKFSVRGRDLGGTVTEAQQRIAQAVKLPTGYRIVWAGEFEELQQAKARLAIIVPISLLMILVLLYGLFNSLRDSLMALLGIPFAAGGGIVALYFSGLDFSISAAVGFVSLFGVSVMNGILIMTYYNEVKASGMGTVEAMFHAAEQRMRPMLMTALSACIGLVAGGGFDRHRQPGAAAARHRRRRRHVHRPDHSACGGAGVADVVPGRRSCGSAAGRVQRSAGE